MHAAPRGRARDAVEERALNTGFGSPVARTFARLTGLGHLAPVGKLKFISDITARSVTFALEGHITARAQRLWGVLRSITPIGRGLAQTSAFIVSYL